MKKRQLFVALDKDGRKVLVDDIDKQSTDKFCCPYCKREVIPKQGEKNVWHFAHKEEVCEYLNIKSSDGLADAKLDFSSSPTRSMEGIELGSDSTQFLCVKCKKRFAKAGGIKWQGNEYVCRECFGGM
jgi:predicted RNA-binding Zn-ribbon protein involved in translation (DUF1610 family)